MATYRYSIDAAANPALVLTDRPLYGSSRLGSNRKAANLYNATGTVPATALQQVDLHYELTDHLGNVATVVTGRLLPDLGTGTNHQADLLSAQGYEPFGSLLPGRNYSSDSYRFGFNGKENDNEVFGSHGTFQDYGFRMYDTRLSRFISVDPLSRQYPFYSPYQFAGNKPTIAIDVDGLEELAQTQSFGERMRPTMDLIKSNMLLNYMLVTDISHPEKAAKQRVIFATHANKGGAHAYTYNLGAAVRRISALRDKGARSLDLREEGDYAYAMAMIKANGLDFAKLEADLDEDEGLFLVSMNEEYFGNLVSTTFSLAHEIQAHLKNALRGKSASALDEHADYYGWDSETPGGITQFNKHADHFLAGGSPAQDEILPASKAGIMMEEIRETFRQASKHSKCSNKSEKGVVP